MAGSSYAEECPQMLFSSITPYIINSLPCDVMSDVTSDAMSDATSDAMSDAMSDVR